MIIKVLVWSFYFGETFLSHMSCIMAGYKIASNQFCNERSYNLYMLLWIFTYYSKKFLGCHGNAIFDISFLQAPFKGHFKKQKLKLSELFYYISHWSYFFKTKIHLLTTKYMLVLHCKNGIPYQCWLTTT